MKMKISLSLFLVFVIAQLIVAPTTKKKATTTTTKKKTTTTTKKTTTKKAKATKKDITTIKAQATTSFHADPSRQLLCAFYFGESCDTYRENCICKNTQYGGPLFILTWMVKKFKKLFNDIFIQNL